LRRCKVASKAFASAADLTEKQQTLEMLADGVYALIAEGDPSIGAIEREDFLVCFEAPATPAAARAWLTRLREHTRALIAERGALGWVSESGVTAGTRSHVRTAPATTKPDPGE
jgi:hypothetical protein